MTISYKTLLLVLFVISSAAMLQAQTRNRPIPVIFDTDIGSDIDDTWALALLLASPELDLKMVVTDSHDVVGRARIVAKFLQSVGRTDVEVGVGKRMDSKGGPQFDWAKDYDLKSYPGRFHDDGVGAMVKMIMSSAQPITLIVVGPAPNIEEALKREPGLAKKARIVAMSGSVYKGYGAKSKPEPEYNVKDHVSSTAAMYRAGWPVLIAPLDTAGLIQLDGEAYRKVSSANNPLCRTLLENYRIWLKNQKANLNFEQQSSTLFDCLAVFLAYSKDFVQIERVKLEVTPEGMTKVSESGSPIDAATAWKDLQGFENFLATRLAAGVQNAPFPPVRGSMKPK
ncbi:MAG: nucleoside hydrolase [Acidobacteria bacterium]|nr:MAG: nucleoside hydrolase [Acidobacteriota bacterium]